MLALLETPHEIAARLAQTLLASLRREGRKTFDYDLPLPGSRRLLIQVKAENRVAVDGSKDLPPDLRDARKSLRRTYRVLRAICEENAAYLAAEPDAEMLPIDVPEIVARLNRDYPEDEPHSADTAAHALTDLRKLNLACPDEEGGWVLVPTTAERNRHAPSHHTHTYSSSASNPARAQRDIPMLKSKTRIWVPGESSEYGVIVIDVITEEEIPVSERIGKMQVPTYGRLRNSAAVQGELVTHDGKLATVRLPGGRQIRTRVLGEWHLKGLSKPDSEEREALNAAGGVA